MRKDKYRGDTKLGNREGKDTELGNHEDGFDDGKKVIGMTK